MILPRKSLYYTLLFIFSGSIIVTTLLVNILIKKDVLITNLNIDILTLLFRTSFSLIGGLISGVIAFTIFDLNRKKEENEKYKSSKKGFSFIVSEIQENKKEASELSDILNGSKEELIAEMITDGTLVESFIIAKTEFTTELIDKTLPNLNEEHYYLVLHDVSTLKKIINILGLITSDVKNKENNIALLKRLKTILDQFNNYPLPRELSKNNTMKSFHYMNTAESNYYKILTKFLFVISIPYCLSLFCPL